MVVTSRGLCGSTHCSRRMASQASLARFRSRCPFRVSFSHCLRSEMSRDRLTTAPEAETSFAGPLVPSELASGSAFLTTASAVNGHAVTSAPVLVLAGRSSQVNLENEPGRTAWMSYLASGGSEVPLAETTVSGSDVPGLDDSATEPAPLASITAGETPWGALLFGANAPAQAQEDGSQQVAELMPLSESALALAATLWTIPSDSPATPLEWGGSSDADVISAARSGSPPRLTTFVIGLDGAFEQTCQDLREGIALSAVRPDEGAARRCARDPWNGTGRSSPRAPRLCRNESGQRPGPPERRRPKSRPGRVERSRLGPRDSSAGGGEDTGGPSRGEGTVGTQSGEERPVVTASIPVLSAISASTIIAGWFWKKRKAWRRERREAGEGNTQ